MRDRGRVRDEEAGIALAVTLAVIAIVSMLTAVVVRNSASTLALGATQREGEQAFHLAEAGASRALGLLSTDLAYATPADASLPAQPIRQDVIAFASNDPADPVEAGSGGEFSWVVPEGRSVVYGVGYAPSRASPDRVRVVEVEYTIVPAGPSPHAVLARGALEIAGDAVVRGPGAAVHSNADLVVRGSARVEGNATATGSASCAAGSVTGRCAGGEAAATLPSTLAADYRDLTAYDLCPDATVRRTEGALAPCTGSLVATGLAPPSGWNGWRFVANRWRARCEIVAASAVNGAGFYVLHKDADVVCPASYAGVWRTTIVVEGLALGGVLQTGDVTLSGRGTISASGRGIALVAGRDVSSPGHLTIAGSVLAAENVSLAGSSRVAGPVVAAGAGDTAGSAARGNALLGNALVEGDFDAGAILGGMERGRWREL